MIEKDDRQLQYSMHKDYFDNCRYAIDNGFYLEAIFLEYAAVESRMEVILGVLGLPCNRYLPHDKRKNVQISHRINCLKYFYKNYSDIFNKSKLSSKFFTDLDKWRSDRNTYIHGLYKNADIYGKRKAECKRLALKGYDLSRTLYNEVNRIKRLKKNHNELFNSAFLCYEKNCCLNVSNIEKEV